MQRRILNYAFKLGLMGILEVSMPVLYGEGEKLARVRLMHEVHIATVIERYDSKLPYTV